MEERKYLLIDLTAPPGLLPIHIDAYIRSLDSSITSRLGGEVWRETIAPTSDEEVREESIILRLRGEREMLEKIEREFVDVSEYWQVGELVITEIYDVIAGFQVLSQINYVSTKIRKRKNDDIDRSLSSSSYSSSQCV